uniref:Uncharacterized protein n=1 Tax=Candidatus Kentrum sp. FW TaxID=2126338 RepID=A0A450SLE8_9GAMM|nr:MAG: hypothetical protein BECKFW1821A_GA0114235_104733 [Candidatus Kentron sp. FW]
MGRDFPHLENQRALSPGKATYFAEVFAEILIKHLGGMEIPVVGYPTEDLSEALPQTDEACSGLD